MSEQLIYVMLFVLTLLTVLNLKLSLGLYRMINNPTPNLNEANPVPIGHRVPAGEGKVLLTGEQGALLTDGKPAALLFLSSKCPTCKEKLPEIESIYMAAEDAGLDVTLVSMESKKRLTHFLNDFSLINGVIIVNKKAYKKLNPSLASPFYLFVDHEHSLQSFGTIGDDDWLSFVGQMRDVEYMQAQA